MNTQQLVDKIRNKLPQKIICLMLAIFLYIFHQVSLIDKKVFVLPLHVIEDGNVMQLGDCPSNVTVIVRAETDDINSIINTDLKASINLSGITETGRVTVPVSITLDEKLLAYDPLEIRVKPENITLNVDNKITKFVNVRPSISGEVAEGYYISQIDVDPSVVGIIGPKTIVDNINEIHTDAIMVSNAERNFSGEVKYFENTKLIDLPNKGPYKVTLTVDPKPLERDFLNIHIVTKSLPENLMVADEIPNIDFKLSGTVPVLGKFVLNINSVMIDLGEITEPGTYDVPVIVTVPENIKLVSKSFETVSVNIVEKPIAMENTENQVVTE